MDVLIFQDRNHLVKLLNNRTIECNQNSKRELVETLFPELLNAELLQAKFKGLTNNAKVVVMQVCYGERIFFSKEELLALIPKSNLKLHKKILLELVNEGFLFVCSNQNYTIPSQLKQVIIRLFKKPFIESALYGPESPNDETTTIKLVEDLLTFVDYVADKPLSLTKAGSLHKKDYLLLMKKFEVQEELPNEQWRFGYGRRFYHYPDRFSLLYDYCFKNGWTIEEDGQLKVTKKISQLEKMTVTDLMNGLIRYWLKLYKRPVPTIGFLYSFVIDILNEIDTIEESVFVDYLKSFVEEYYFDDAEKIIKARLLKMLEQFQLIKVIEVNNIRCYSFGITKNILFPKKK